MTSINNEIYRLKNENEGMSSKFDEKEVELTRMEREAIKKSEELKNMNDIVGKKEDLLKSLNIKIIEVSLKAYNDSVRANEEKKIAEQDKVFAENSSKWTIGIAFGFVLLSILIATIYYLRKKRKFDQYISVKNSEIQQSNSRAAISQLYARTDSHDLGHVLDAYKSIADFASDERNGQYFPLGDISQELKTKFACHEISVDTDDSEKEILTPKFSILPNLMGYFNQYLKTRMDFRADVATSDPNSLTTLDFYQDVFSPFNNNLIFNNRISGISDKELKYQFKIFKGKRI
ncbi:MAG: hypothetical protein NTY07_20360 [Bacteroidia bacterium]|nr:hypothetical protein [Bacteroidia bacterium]